MEANPMKKNKDECLLISTSFYLDRKYIQTAALWCLDKSNFIWNISRPEEFYCTSRILVLPLILVSFDESVDPKQIEQIPLEIYNGMRWDVSSLVLSDIDRLVRKEFLQRQAMDIIHTLIPNQSLKVKFL